MCAFTTILWDVDGTLLNFEKSERYAITFCLQKFHLQITETIINRYSQINDSYWKRLEKGEITNKADVLVGRFQSLFDEFGMKGVSAEEFQEEYKDALGSVYYYLDHSFELCKSLQGTYRQYIVTNGIAYTQEKKLRAAGFYDIMDGVFISEQIGYPKPQTAFFEGCFAQIGNVEKEKTIIIGDSLSSDILGGILAGITVCWYNPKKKQNTTDMKIDFEMEQLEELLPILEGKREKANV